ncbi:MAG: DUF4411 family protein [Motilibacteraceae bacterium]
MYLLDANVFISANRLHYGLDFAPGFWDWMLRAHGWGRIASVSAVEQELRRLQDNLSTWATSSCPTGFFEGPLQATATSMSQLSVWAMGHANYKPAAKSTFLASADYVLIAHAHATRRVVVTHEKSEPNSKKNIKMALRT